MKYKFLFAGFVVFIVFACQKDDDTPQIETVDNPITGKWKPLQNVKVYEDNSETVSVFPYCTTTTNSSLYFSDDINQLFYYNFYEQKEDGSCFYTGGQGNWQQLEENNYKVSLDYFDDNDYQSDTTETFLYHIDFISNDSIKIHNKTLLLQLQIEEPDLADFYRIYKKQRIPFE